MTDSTITFITLGVIVVLFVTNRVPVAIIAVGTALSLWATGVLDLDQATAGFGDPTVLFIAALFVVSESLDATGVTTWVGQQLIDRAGTGRTRIVVYMMIVSGLLTALITPNASVAALVPVVVIIAVRVGQNTSQLLIPLAFAAHAGALLALTGSPVSVIVSEAADDAGVGQFGFFEFALTGIPLLVGTIVIIVVLGPKLLPQRNAARMPADLSDLEATLTHQYRIDGENFDRLFTRKFGASEVVVPPRSPLVGQRVYPGMRTDSGDLVIVAILRDERRVDDPAARIAVGDTLLVRGTWQALSTQIEADDGVLVVDQPDVVRRQVVPLGIGAKESIAVLAVMILLLATNALPPAVAGLGAACALILLRVLTVDQAYRAIGWTTVILVAGMIPLSTAMRVTGAADDLANALVDVVGDAGPYPLLIGIFVLTATLGQLISNMATALIMIPIALSAAAELDVAAAPVLMSLNVAAAAALLTPVATPANLMVMEPGGYRFNDYWKLGVVVLAWYFVIAVILVPAIWKL
ncbi:MAG TPA: SLC13 family permease [Ilumatobacteraceae bacterium]|nr:SLC13 family permease [Ilumatobacteraceae bacterium]